jgi:glycosyltransferase involved in cell wall biosynthesis
MAENYPSISVCTISGAEAGRIGRALASVQDWTLERIVVLNEEVRDGTEEIAVKLGARVYREKWKGYIAQKNSAAEKAKGEWILDLDADEAVSPELRDEILRTLSNPDLACGATAFSFPRLSWYCGRWIRHGDWYPDRTIRLWRKGKARWGGVDPHAILKVDGAISRLRADLLHFSRESINVHLGKLSHFSDEFVRQHKDSATVPGVFDLAARPLWRFVRAYFLRLGFLDGWPGYYIAAHTSFSTLLRYAKLREARLLNQAPPSSHDTTSSR